MAHEPGRRRVLVLDLMILVFALAGGLSQALHLYREASDYYQRNSPRIGLVWGIADTATLSIAATEPVVELLAVALIAVRLIPPRPEVRDLARQPGLIACCNIVLSMILGWIWLYAVLCYNVNHVMKLYEPRSIAILAVPAMMRGAAVAAGWFTMALTGSMKLERGWVELIGIALGLYFVALIPIWSWILVA